MFDLFGNIEQHQKDLQEKLAQITIEHQSDDGAVKVILDGNRKLRDLVLDPGQFEPMDWEKLQDLVILTINEAAEQAEIQAAEVTNKLMSDMLPGGLSGLGKLFGS